MIKNKSYPKLPNRSEAEKQFKEAGLSVRFFDARERGVISYPRVVVLASDENIYTCDLLRNRGQFWEIEKNPESNADKLKNFMRTLINAFPCTGTDSNNDTCGVTYTCTNCLTARQLRAVINSPI